MAAQWNPAAFNPDAWLDLMNDAGMSYICLTARHQDGFCLWDTKATRFKTMNTPFGRDVVRMLADACHRRRVPLCLYYSIEALSFSRRIEASQSVGVESWGYRRDESYYTDRQLMRSIDKYRARDANDLLDVGPKPDGTIPSESAAILRRIGQWHGRVREAFDGAVPASNLTANRSVLLTRRGNMLYVHVHRDPVSDSLKLKRISRLPQRATLLNTGRPVGCVVDMAPGDHLEQAASLRLTSLPVNELSNTVMVVTLEFDGEPGAGLPPGHLRRPDSLASAS